MPCKAIYICILLMYSCACKF